MPSTDRKKKLFLSLADLFTYLLAVPHGRWDLTRDQTCAPVVEALSQPLDHQGGPPWVTLISPPPTPAHSASATWATCLSHKHSTRVPAPGSWSSQSPQVSAHQLQL